MNRALFAVLALTSLIWSWNQPLFSAHYFRQAQTAQTADVFLKEGWDPLLPKLRSMGRPGYSLLEFPVYQSATAGLSAATHLSIDQSGRLLSWLSALLFVLGMIRVAEALSARKCGSMAIAALSSPLVFGISQWHSIEMSNAALGIWSLYFFIRAREAPRAASLYAWSLVSLLVCAALSLAIKPVVIFVLFPVFAWVAFRQFDLRRAAWSALPCVFAAALAALWQVHAAHVAATLEHTNKIQGNFGWYFFSAKSFRFHSLLKIAGRYLIYVLGPGGCALIAFALVKRAELVRENWRKNRSALTSLLLGVILYTFVFLNLNIEHSYYQLPACAALYTAFLILGSGVFEGRGAIALLALAALANLAVAQTRLARQDHDWPQAIAYLKEHLAGHLANSSQDLSVVSNNQAVPVALAYYLDHYLDSTLSSALERAVLVSDRPWLAVCDQDGVTAALEDDFGHCKQVAQAAFATRHAESASFGHLWVSVAR